MDLQSVLSAIESWPVDDRLRLIEEVWESLEGAPEATTLSEAHKQDLQRRLDAYRDNPEVGSPWDEVRSRIRGGRR